MQHLLLRRRQSTNPSSPLSLKPISGITLLWWKVGDDIYIKDFADPYAKYVETDNKVSVHNLRVQIDQ
jgi:hypothetical protein